MEQQNIQKEVVQQPQQQMQQKKDDEFGVVTDISECEKLWKTFSSDKKISDMWEFKFCFHKYFNNVPHFIVHKKNGKVLGLLPLSYDNDQKLFKFFPGKDEWIEKNSFFLNAKRSLKALIGMCPNNTKLSGIAEIPSYKSMFENDDFTYSLFPAEFNFDLNNYFKLFKRKHVRNILRDIRKLNELKVEVIRNPESHKQMYETMRLWNVQTFGKNSYFEDERFVKAFGDVFDLFVSKNMLYMTAINVNGELAAIDLGCVYNNIMTVFVGGVNPKFRNKGIAKYINLEHIKYAFEHKLEKIEFLAFSFNWKEMWHLKKERLFKFLK